MECPRCKIELYLSPGKVFVCNSCKSKYYLQEQPAKKGKVQNEYGYNSVMDKAARDRYAKAYYDKDEQGKKKAETTIIMRELINILTDYYSPIKTQ